MTDPGVPELDQPPPETASAATENEHYWNDSILKSLIYKLQKAIYGKIKMYLNGFKIDTTSMLGHTKT